MGSIPNTLTARRPAYLDAAPLLPPAPPELDSRQLQALYRDIWAGRDKPDHYVRQEPYTGGLIRVAQAVREAPEATALTYALKTGDPTDPEVAYQFRRAAQGVADAARMFDLPVVEEQIVHEPERGLWPELEVRAHGSGSGQPAIAGGGQGPSIELRQAELLVVAGRMTNDLSGSLALDALPAETLDPAFKRTSEGEVASLPPPIDLVAEQRVLDLIRAARPLLIAAVPLGRGGLLITLARCCARSRLGAAVRLVEGWRGIAPVALLFGEAQSRFLLALPPEGWPALHALARPLEVALQEIGTAAGQKLTVEGAINLDLGRVKAWS